jgi:thiopurine S-methyltransferase
MDTSFWQQRWGNNDIAFHKKEANPLLVKYFKALSIEKSDRIFLPLCGKTLDWLLSNGYRIAGAELSEIAIKQLFVELGIEPKILVVDNMLHYSATNIDIFVGDIFNLSGNMLGPVNAIYDRAALVALPKEMRDRYTAHLIKITDKAQQLLICYQYDQNLMEGPPFSIIDEEVKQHYQNTYTLTLLARVNVFGGLKGQCAAMENVWLLQNS